MLSPAVLTVSGNGGGRFYGVMARGGPLVLKGIRQPTSFYALNVERKQLADADEIAAFFAKYGVSKEEFNKAFNAFGVTNAVRQADKRARAYRISGTPEMIVAGKYRVTARMAGGQSEMLQVVDHIVGLERDRIAAAVASS